MADRVSQELKELYSKVCELEDEMSVTTKNNIYIDDLKKSKKLLIYRYALLLQIKDIRDERRKIETRIAKINTLQAQAARGRMLTQRESDAISHVNKDVRKREEIVELYDNKKEIYSDKRLAYYGIDEHLIEIFNKYANELESYFIVNEKNVNELKKQLNDNNNIKDDMNHDEIVSANEERYGDEIVDFELGIIFDFEKENQINANIDSISTDETNEEIKTINASKNIKNEIVNENNKAKKFNYYNGYNLFKDDMDEIIFDSIEKEIMEDIKNENKNISITAKTLLDNNLSDEKIFDKFEFTKEEENKNIEENIKNKTINSSDNNAFKKSCIKKTLKSVKDKLALKEKLENYINEFGNDYTREYYNNIIRNTKLDDQDSIDRIDTDLYLDIYQLGILYYVDQLIKRKKATNSDPMEIKILINKLYQSKMQYKLFPGMNFEDIDEYDPEVIINAVKKFDDCDTYLDKGEMYRVANLRTFDAEFIKARYRIRYGIDNVIISQSDLENDKEDEEDVEIK